MLREFLEKALELGAEGLEICYKDRQERIFAVRDPISVGTDPVLARHRRAWLLRSAAG
jgi:hypothetical protein